MTLAETQRAGIHGEQLALSAFVACNIFVAVNPIAIRFTLRELSPLWGSGLRLLLAGTLLLALVGVLRLELPRGRAFGGALVFGVLNHATAVALAYYAFAHVHAGFGQTVLAIVPLVTLLLAVLQRQERLRPAAVVGAVVALTGVLVMAQAPVRDTVPTWSLLALLGSALCVAQSAVLVRRMPPMHPVTMNAIGVTAAAALLIPLSFLAGESIVLPHDSSTWVALAYLVGGSVLVYVLYLVLLGRWAASRVAYMFVTAPFLTLVLSTRLDDEPLSKGLAVGGIAILVGVYVGAFRTRAVPVLGPTAR